MANSARYSQSAISITSYLHRPTTRDVHLKARRRAANQGAQAEKYARSPEQADQDAATASESASFCRCQKFSARLSEVLHTRLMRPRGGRQVQLLPALRLPPSRVKLLVDLLARLRLAREISVLTRRVLGCHNRRILIKQLPPEAKLVSNHEWNTTKWPGCRSISSASDGWRSSLCKQTATKGPAPCCGRAASAQIGRDAKCTQPCRCASTWVSAERVPPSAAGRGRALCWHRQASHRQQVEPGNGRLHEMPWVGRAPSGRSASSRRLR